MGCLAKKPGYLCFVRTDYDVFFGMDVSKDLQRWLSGWFLLWEMIYFILWISTFCHHLTMVWVWVPALAILANFIGWRGCFYKRDYRAADCLRIYELMHHLNFILITVMNAILWAHVNHSSADAAMYTCISLCSLIWIVTILCYHKLLSSIESYLGKLTYGQTTGSSEVRYIQQKREEKEQRKQEKIAIKELKVQTKKEKNEKLKAQKPCFKPQTKLEKRMIRFDRNHDLEAQPLDGLDSDDLLACILYSTSSSSFSLEADRNIRARAVTVPLTPSSYYSSSASDSTLTSSVYIAVPCSASDESSDQGHMYQAPPLTSQLPHLYWSQSSEESKESPVIPILPTSSSSHRSLFVFSSLSNLDSQPIITPLRTFPNVISAPANQPRPGIITSRDFTFNDNPTDLVKSLHHSAISIGTSRHINHFQPHKEVHEEVFVGHATSIWNGQEQE